MTVSRNSSPVEIKYHNLVDATTHYLIRSLAEVLDKLSDHLNENYSKDEMIDVGEYLVNKTTSDADRMLIDLVTSSTYIDDVKEFIAENVTSVDIQDLAQDLRNAAKGSLETCLSVLANTEDQTD